MVVSDGLVILSCGYGVMGWSNEPVSGVEVVIVESDGAATVVESGGPGSVV